MKKILLLILIFSAVISAKSQILPRYNFNNQNLTLINPANSGNDALLTAMIGQRVQWVGTPGAPQVTYLSLDGAVAENMGLGAIINNQRIGIFNMFDIQADYAYKIELSGGHKISFGVDLNFLQNSINTSSLYDEEMQDPALNSENFNHSLFYTGFGVVYNWQNLTVAVSSPIIYSTQTNQMFQTNYLYGAYTFYLGDSTWIIQPSVLGRYAIYSPIQGGINILTQYNRKVWIQTGYNSDKEINLGLGIDIYKLKIGYSYELGLKPVSYLSKGTHEFFVMFKLPFKSKAEE